MAQKRNPSQTACWAKVQFRHRQYQSFLDNFLVQFGGGKPEQDAREANACTWCGEKVTGFKDEISLKEYNISGFCQECQDKTFG